MKYKKIMLILITAIFLASIAGVCASDANDTMVAGDDTGKIELSHENEMSADNLQTGKENDELALADNDESVSAQTDTEVLSVDNSTYSKLSTEINQSGNVKLAYKNYVYDNGDPISITEDNKVIDGNGAIIDMTGSTIRAFDVIGNGVTIKNLTIKNVNFWENGGAIKFAGDSGTVINCNFINNTAQNGGAIYMDAGTVTNCNFNDNTATDGGAVYFWNAGNVTNCNFTNNTAGEGWGGAISMDAGTVTNCNFNDNTATDGGAVYFWNAGNVTNCNFINNKATAYKSCGGAIRMSSGSVTNCNFTDNEAYQGGAVYFSSNGEVRNCNLTGNTATYGGAISMSSGSVTNCNFTANTANEYGGAVYFDSDGNLTNCNFTSNTANEYGGAVYFDSGNVTNCNFTDNKATGTDSWGGAVYFNREGTVTNCNFTSNTANEYGGAVYFLNEGTVTNCNFADNTAFGDGGAIYSFYWSTADTCIFKTGSDTTFNIGILPPMLNVDNFTTFYGSGEKLTFNLTTDSGMPVTNGNISISVYFKDNNSWVRNYSCLSGEGWIPDLPVGSYYANFTTEYAGFQAITRTITINKVKTELTAKAVTAAYNSNKKLIISLKDVNGKPLSGVKVTVKIKSDKTYTTDANGQIKINVANLVPNTYTVKITFNGDANYDMSSKDVKVTVTKATPKLTAKAKSFKKSVKTKKYTVTLKDNNGKAMKKVKLTLKVKGKTYKAKTNAKSKATFKIKNLKKKGKYRATVKFSGNNYYNKVTKKVKITVK